MKKKHITAILIVLFVTILSVNFVSAWWDTFECEGFDIKIPEGLTEANGHSSSDLPNHIPLVSTDRDKWDYNYLDLSEVPLEKLPDNINIVENHTEDNLTIVKGHVSDGVYPNYFDGANITYAEFDKEGKHFYLVINHYNRITLDEINLNDDMKLINELIESIELK